MAARNAGERAGGALDIRAGDLAEVLAKRNPGAAHSLVAYTARLMAAVGTAVDTGPPFERSPPSGGSPVESSAGRGLGARIGRDEGGRRLAAYAAPLGLEDWAGPVAGPVELELRLGIARSTLQDWRRSGAVIGLLKGSRKHVFPLAQFVDGRPVRGLADLIAIARDARTAWLWLVEPRERGASPLEDLSRGRIDEVLQAARDDFA